jgi:hypothetical protein
MRNIVAAAALTLPLLAACSDPGLVISIEASDDVQERIESLKVDLVASQRENMFTCRSVDEEWSGSDLPIEIIVEPGNNYFECVAVRVTGNPETANEFRVEQQYCVDLYGEVTRERLEIDARCLDTCDFESQNCREGECINRSRSFDSLFERAPHFPQSCNIISED